MEDWRYDDYMSEKREMEEYTFAETIYNLLERMVEKKTSGRTNKVVDAIIDDIPYNEFFTSGPGNYILNSSIMPSVYKEMERIESVYPYYSQLYREISVILGSGICRSETIHNKRCRRIKKTDDTKCNVHIAIHNRKRKYIRDSCVSYLDNDVLSIIMSY